MEKSGNIEEDLEKYGNIEEDLEKYGNMEEDLENGLGLGEWSRKEKQRRYALPNDNYGIQLHCCSIISSLC